jgi:hypothetical protein
MRMTRERIRMLTWMMAILVPATFAIAAGLHTTPEKSEPEGGWYCTPEKPSPSPARLQA